MKKNSVYKKLLYFSGNILYSRISYSYICKIYRIKGILPCTFDSDHTFYICEIFYSTLLRIFSLQDRVSVIGLFENSFNKYCSL
jgi:hypothetical protein